MGERVSQLLITDKLSIYMLYLKKKIVSYISCVRTAFQKLLPLFNLNKQISQEGPNVNLFGLRVKKIPPIKALF